MHEQLGKFVVAREHSPIWLPACPTWMVTTSSLTATTEPWIPPEVTTGSPFLSPPSISSRRFLFFFSGRMTISQKTTMHMDIGTSIVSRMPGCGCSWGPAAPSASEIC